jgi:hypothetical protein
VITQQRLGAVKVPYLDTEVRGVFGLKYLGDTAYGMPPEVGAFKDLFDFGGAVSTRFVLLGGKVSCCLVPTAAARGISLHRHSEKHRTLTSDEETHDSPPPLCPHPPAAHT